MDEMMNNYFEIGLGANLWWAFDGLSLGHVASKRKHIGKTKKSKYRRAVLKGKNLPTVRAGFYWAPNHVESLLVPSNNSVYVNLI